MKNLLKIALMISLSLLISLLIFYHLSSDGLLVKICGFGILEIESGSMEDVLSVGDFIIIKEYDDYKVDDVITYNQDNQYLVTHRIIRKEGNNFITKGDNNNTEDSEIVTLENIEGKMIYNSKLIKFLYKYWIAIIIAILVVLILW